MSADDNMASDNNDVASDNADELLRIWGYPASRLSRPRGENIFLLDQASGFLETEPANFKKIIAVIS